MPSPHRRTALCLIAIAVALATSGCGEDRSNLLPGDTASRIESNLDRVQSLVREGRCFDALDAAEEVRNDVEALGNNVDSSLRLTLLDGVTQLQITVQSTCVEADTDPTVTEPVPEAPETVDPQPQDGTTGSTGPAGETGATGDANDGGTTPEPAPKPAPEPKPKPDPVPPDNDSGGVSPSAGSGGTSG
jgi:hypothetical protein